MIDVALLGIADNPSIFKMYSEGPVDPIFVLEQ